MDMRLELVPLPTSEVERSKEFYVDRVGFHLDHDVKPGNGFRVVQLTPPGSACSIVIGVGMTDPDAPRVQNLHLVVDDIDHARTQLMSKGVDVSDVDDMGGVKYAHFNDPDGNGWALQQMPRPTRTGGDAGEPLSSTALAGAVTILFGGVELIDDVKELWLSLFDHHGSVGAGGLPVIDRAESWPRRRQLYQSLLGTPGAVVVLARRGADPVGYALVHIHSGADDTWPTGPMIAEIETLAVAPDERGRGLGTALLDATERHLAARGVHDIKLSVIVGNEDAMRFYRRRGMTPVMTTFLKLRPRTET